MHGTNGTSLDVESAARPALGPAPPTFLTATTNDTRSKDIHSNISTPSIATIGTMCLVKAESSLDALPDELLLQILGHLDYPFLLALSRVRDLGLCCGSLLKALYDRCHTDSVLSPLIVFCICSVFTTRLNTCLCSCPDDPPCGPSSLQLRQFI